jgi:regulator of ribonuclease activity A
MDFSTSDIHDAHSQDVSVCDVQFRGFGRRTRFAGPCTTVRTFEDHRPVREALEQPGNGRVLVVDGGNSLRFALLGDRMVDLAMRNGWVGAVLYAAIRDSEAIDTLDFGVKAVGTTARRPVGGCGGILDVPVTLGGALFRPGDWIYADADAVLVAVKRLHGEGL